jgi:hypothetical protein
MIMGALETTSVMTATRRLSELGYLSSYSHRGRYYTLTAIPQFDVDGLWRFEGIGFSRCGTLKNTVPALVERSEAGLFHRDLEARLQVRVHDTLLDLVHLGRIGRARVDGEFLYVSADADHARMQIARRESKGAAGPDHAGAVSPTLVLEVLLDVIQTARLRSEPAAVAARLASRGLAVTEEQVRAVFRQYGLPEKKTRSRQRSSPP